MRRELVETRVECCYRVACNHPHFIAQTNHTKSTKQRYHSLSTEIKDHLGVFLLELSREAAEADAKSLEGLGSGGGPALPWPLLLLLVEAIPPGAAAAVATGSGGSRRLGGLGTLAQREHGARMLVAQSSGTQSLDCSALCSSAAAGPFLISWRRLPYSRSSPSVLIVSTSS